MTPTPESASEFLARSDFIWHQRFELAPGVWTPGVSDVAWLWRQGGLPQDLSGATVLDIGTTNAGSAFEAERRGAARVVAADIFGPEHFGVGALIEFLSSRVQFVTATVYELSARLRERFDLVIFWGVLYHLRHPLLALDNVRAVTGLEVSLETAVCDAELPRSQRERRLVRFYRRDELDGDPTNWFSPTVATLRDWCASSGFEADVCGVWPQRLPQRAMLRLRPAHGSPEFAELSYERPLRCSPA